MTFKGNYPNRKDQLGTYYGSKAIDSSCCNRGSCPWCKGKRKYKEQRLKLKWG